MKQINKKGLYVLSGLGLGALILFACATADKQEDKQYQQQINNDYAIYAVPMPDSLNLANEFLPLNDAEVYERMDRELHVNTYWQSNSFLLIKRAHKYFPIIEPILKKNGVPDDFKYLAVIESGLTNVVSPAGAAGFWQFLKGTAQDFNLVVDGEVDERYHLEKSTEAACKYLLQAKAKFGTWTMAAASYNMGMAGLEKQLERQKTDNYYDLLLNSETSRYVLRIIALKEIMNHPKKYGFNYREKDLYTFEPLHTLTVDTAITDLADFAKSRNITYKTLKFYNPWLRQVYLNNPEKRSYKILVPKQ